MPPSRESTERFIRRQLPLRRAPGVPDIVLHTAHSASGLRRLCGAGAAPYWAWPWAGGLLMARHLLDHPELVRDRHLLDLGAGSGLVGIAASLAGARKVLAAETDHIGVLAITLNAAANGAAVAVLEDDVTSGAPPPVDVVAVGDLFYDAALAVQVTRFLDRCLGAGIEVLIGDPGRAHLPRARLRLLAEYPVTDFAGGSGEAGLGGVFRLVPEAGGG